MSQSDFVSRGQALVASGQFQEAVKVCRLGLLGRPTTVEGRIVLGQALLALKRFDEVLAEMRVALELDRTAIGAHTLKAEALLKKGDTHGAIETLHGARAIAPADPRVLHLLGEAEHGPKATSAAYPAAQFVGAGDTKHYPGQPPGGDEFGPEASEGFTKPTAVQSPLSARRAEKPAAASASRRREPTPPPDVLAVGDRSGTVEVDPALEGVQVDDELDFDKLAAPPSSRLGAKRSAPEAKAQPKAKSPAPAPARRPATVDLEPDDDSDVIELDETRGRPQISAGEVRRASSSAVRNAVKLPSGPIDVDEEPVAPPRNKPRSVPPPSSSPIAMERTIPAPHAPPMPALMAAHAPTMMAPPALPLPPAPRAPLAAALPTLAAVQPPHGGMPPHGQPHPAPLPLAPLPSPQQIANAQRRTVAIAPPVGNDLNHVALAPTYVAGQQPHWSVAAAQEPTARAGEPIDPHLQMLMDGRPSEQPLVHDAPPPRTGMRKTRTRLSIVLWIVVGVAVIGGGVFAGFQIRGVRLGKQIAAAREQATDFEKSDTWTGWTAAEGSLAGIVQASGTLANRAALARARALIAYEFGDSAADAKSAVDALAGAGGLDGDLAVAYLALAESNGKAAKLAADAALQEAPTDPAASYVAGQATLLLGTDVKAAVKLAKQAVDKEPRPLYALGLARAQAAAYAWSDALAAVERARSADRDQPAAAIAGAVLLADAGLLGANAMDVRTQLDKVIAEGRRPAAAQPHGVSPAQVAFAELALARVDYARGDAAAARNDVAAAAKVGLDDQRFAERAVGTLLETGEPAVAEKAARSAIASFPGSRRARLALARAELAEGQPRDALDVFAKQPELEALPLGRALRGQAKLATGDLDGARADFDAALQKEPHLEPALVGQAWLELATGDVDAARKRFDPAALDKGASPAAAIVECAILRRGDAAAKDKARAVLEKLATGVAGAETPRAELELARVYRDQGDFGAARKMYATAGQAGNAEARLEGAVLATDDRDPTGGRETLDALLKAAGDSPTAELVLETARARMLVGDHGGAAHLLETADKLPGIVKWKLQREKGRLYLRRGDLPAAVTALGSALDGCGDDPETFLLAADAATMDTVSGLADKLKKLMAQRLKNSPIAQIATGKLLLQAGSKDTEAEAAYRAARDALRAQKAPARLIAQADYGLAVVAYNKAADRAALDELNSVLNGDPSLYDAYLFKADLLQNKKDAFEQAQIAVRYNPDYPRAWIVLGKLAAKNNDKATLAQAIARLQVIAPTSQDLRELLKLRR